jgi:hypothetical protein
MAFSPVRLPQATPRRKFSEAEDRRLRILVGQLGTSNWDEVARSMGSRTARQCRDRYKNYLLDSLSRSPWTAEEDALLMRQFQAIGPKWVEIAKMLTGRSTSHVKNRWHRHLALQRWESATQVGSEGEDDEDPQDSGPEEKDEALLLCPAITLSGGDWTRIFDRIEETISHVEKPPGDAEKLHD